MNTRSLPLRAAWLAFALLASARADQSAPSLDDRLARIEQQLAQLQARVNHDVTADDLAPTVNEVNDLTHQLGWDGKSALTVTKAGGTESKLALGGFVQALFESGTAAAPDARFAGMTNGFMLRRARLYAAGVFAEDFSFKLESDFGNNSLAPKTGLSGQLTDAYVTWTKFPEANLRLGQFKTPFGYEQLASDTRIYTIERSQANDKLTLSRQIGAMITGDVVDKRVNYSVGAFNGTGTNIGSNDNQKFMWVARTSAVAFDGQAGAEKVRLTSGVDYFTTVDKGTFTGHRYGWSADTQLVVGPAELQAEWLRNDQHPVTGSPTAADGWAILGAYSVTKQWQGVVRYESFDSNTLTPNTTTDMWTFGVNYLIKGDDLKVSLDYLSGDQPAPAPHGDRILARLQVMF